MPIEDIVALFDRRQQFWTSRDIEAFLTTYTQDCVVETQLAGTVEGRQAVGRLERELFASFPDLSLDQHEIVQAGGRVILIGTISGTDRAGTLAAPGKSFRFPIVVLYTVRDGLVAAERRIWDFSGFVLERIQRDLKVAAEVQQMLLPDGRFAGQGFEAAAASVPCRVLGGDFFDYFSHPDGRFAFALGDVAGKGPPAALLGASLLAILGVSPPSEGPRSILDSANRAMLRRAVPGRYATVVYAALLPGGGLTYCNAGHNPPLVVGKSGRRWLRAGGTVIGLFEGTTFEEETLQLQDGDVLVAFSDGITEAASADGEEFGEDRLASLIEAHAHLPPPELVQRVLHAVHQFSKGMTQGDDLTVLVLSYQRKA